ncbi:MAG: EamA family transporter [Hyphomicrobiales bacterium]|nr:EamA family transporter [Hyphomicrobiales bacterium]
MSMRGATAVGLIAILLWSLLAALTTLSGQIPPFQLVAMSFALAGALGLVYLARDRQGLRFLSSVPPGAWALGVAGLFGYHFFFFLALRSAPAAEANLINYLWPLLIVLFSALLPARGGAGGLKWWHVTGAMLGLAGTALIIAGGSGESAESVTHTSPWFGYTAALIAAFVWSGYSVANRRFTEVPSASVAGFCLVTSVLATVAHLLFEETLWPASTTEWLAAIGLGLGPVGAAFYVWDYAVKHGDIRVLGAAAYAIPLLSTLLLVALGIASAEPVLWLACALITGGAILAAKEMLFPARK